MEDGQRAIRDGKIPVIVDPNAEILNDLKPDVLVDAIIAKKNLGTCITDAPLVIGVGPGFTAGIDCHKVIETKRGHYLGKVIDAGSAIPNTGVPGDIGGYTVERIIRATADGYFLPKASIGEMVEKGQLIAYSGEVPVYALIQGIVRGMLQEGVEVTKGMKAGDIDARCEIKHCFSISDNVIFNSLTLFKYISSNSSCDLIILQSFENPKEENAIISSKVVAISFIKNLFIIFPPF